MAKLQKVHLTRKMNSVLFERELKIMKNSVNLFSISILVIDLFCFFVICKQGRMLSVLLLVNHKHQDDNCKW